MKSFEFEQEKILIERHWPALSEAEDRLHAILVPENRAKAIQPQQFADLYGEKAIQRDLAFVASREIMFAREGDEESKDLVRRGELFEAIVNSQIEDSNWMGQQTSVIVPSRYDDIVNGVDSIVEFEVGQSRSHLALAVDITKSQKELEKKFGSIKRSIDKGNLSVVKYMKFGKFRGELAEVPRVVVGADEKAMEELSHLLLMFKMRQRRAGKGDPKEFKQIRDGLEHHRVQFQILYAIQAQLIAFRDYALGSGRKGKELASRYEEVLEIINDIIAEKGAGAPKSEDLELDDNVYAMIMEGARSFGKKK